MSDLAFLREPAYAHQLDELARRLSTAPENEPGADKTWVLASVRGVVRALLEGSGARLDGAGPLADPTDPDSARSRDDGRRAGGGRLGPAARRHAPSVLPSALPEPFREDVMDPFVEACAALERAGVPYLVIGACGLNLRARHAGVVVATLDCDLLLRAEPDDFGRALPALRAAGFALSVGGEPFVGEHPDDLAGIVRTRSSVRAIKRGWPVDLLSHAAAIDFDDSHARLTRYRVQGVDLAVAPLEAIVASKRAADRPKDRVILEMWREQLDGLIAEERGDRPP